MYVYIYIYIYTCIHKYTYTYVYVSLPLSLSIYIYIHTYVYVYIHVYMYIYIYIYIYDRGTPPAPRGGAAERAGDDRGAEPEEHGHPEGGERGAPPVGELVEGRQGPRRETPPPDVRLNPIVSFKLQ